MTDSDRTTRVCFSSPKNTRIGTLDVLHTAAAIPYGGHSGSGWDVGSRNHSDWNDEDGLFMPSSIVISPFLHTGALATSDMEGVAPVISLFFELETDPVAGFIFGNELSDSVLNEFSPRSEIALGDETVNDLDICLGEPYCELDDHKSITSYEEIGFLNPIDANRCYVIHKLWMKAIA